MLSLSTSNDTTTTGSKAEFNVEDCVVGVTKDTDAKAAVFTVDGCCVD